ncbi:MAG: M20/M25/M40 family metallo-hydrolase [candidate division WOR-3 bacterium]|nr:M20/M25/M40 family metallo-hydrolase [candidate division WOR-3 bacterium]
MIFLFYFLMLYGQEYLVKTVGVNVVELNKKDLTVLCELSDGIIVMSSEAKLSKLTNIRYTVLDVITPQKEYYLVYPLNKNAEQKIRKTYQVLTEGEEYLLISVQPNEIHKLTRLPVMLSKIQLQPMVISQTEPTFPQVVYNPIIAQMVSQVSSDSVLSFVRRLQNFRTRYSSTDSCRASANWLRAKFLNYNCDSVYLHNYNTSYAPNVVAIKRGIAQPDNVYVVICGHFDSTSNQSPSNCPGADDNASGTAAVLEAARIFKNYNFEYSIRFIAFSGEEQGLYGSAAYAQQARNQGDSIIGVLNFDMIGYVDATPEDLDVIGKVSNPNCSTFVNFFINSANTYTTLPTIRRMVTSAPYSDHHSFWQRGYVGFCGIEDYMPPNPHYHLTSDTIGAGFNSLPFCTEVIKACVAASAGLANPITPNQPYVVFRNYRIADSVTGNNNRRWDVGETVNLLIWLRNIGQIQAHNVSATIACNSPYVTIYQNQSTYGNISGLDSALNQTPYLISSAPNTPIGYNADFSLTISSAETTWQQTFRIPIGQFVSTDPIPDGPRTPSLYWAYDNTDTLYAPRPVYNWIEIKNLGTRLTFDHNDQVRIVELPNRFGSLKYYGQNYNTISVSVDGWLRCGSDTTGDYSNSSIPNVDGPSAMIAINWDDLVHSNSGAGGVYWYYDPTSRYLIIEWDSLSYYSASSIRDKFQVLIGDSTHRTPTGDNLIIAQYQTANRYSSSTVGIENQTETIGIQYLFDGSYHPAAALIQPQRAIKYITQAPTGFIVSETPSNLSRSGISVFPNPFRNQIVISLYGISSLNNQKMIKIYNSSGRLVRSFSSPIAIWDGKDDAGQRLGAGIYFIKAQNITRPQKVIYLH